MTDFEQCHTASDTYFELIDGVYAQEALQKLVIFNTPYADASSNPDLGTKRIYKVEGHEPGSDIARIIEADVLEKDKRWNQSREETASDNEALEQSSTFFILIDGSDEHPESIGSIRIVDCEKGTSETEQFFRAIYGDEELPDELKMLDGRQGVWDIVYATVRHEHQDNLNASWLYYAMHKHSRELDVARWISNITDIEYKMLRSLGIPFEPIPGLEKVGITNPVTGKKLKFGFYHADADKVQQSVEDKAEELLEKDALKFATCALISRFGSVEKTRSTNTIISIAS